jgi:hypothetical protein
MEQSVCTGGMEVENTIHCGRCKPATDQRYKCVRDRFFTEVSLAKNGQDVSDTRPRRFAEHVVALDPINVFGGGGSRVPLGQERLRVPNQRPGLDDPG